MTGIERLRKYAECGTFDVECKRVTKMFGKSCCDFEDCDDCREFVCNAIADQIEREIDEAVADEVADTLDAYEMNTNARWHSAVEEGAESDCKAEYELISRYWLPRPRFEDGEPVKVGDRFLNALGRECVVHSVVSSDAFGRRIEGIVYASNCDCHITVGEGERVKRPDPPDSWERIEADVEACDGSACRYFKRDYSPMKHSCEGCRSAGVDEDCLLYAMQDVLGRAKKLAGVEE